MAEPEEDLFPPEVPVQELLGLLRSGGRTTSIAYTGRALENGRMDAVLLADGLRGYGRFVNRLAQLHLGPFASEFSLEVQGELHSGSLEVYVRLFHPISETLREVADSRLLTGLAIIATLSGLSAKDAGKSLIATFKKRKGRPFKSGADFEDIPKEIPVTQREYVRLFNDEEIQAYLRASFRPVRQPGIDEFETRSNSQVVDSISKADLLAADQAELEAVITDETKTLDIEKVSFLPHLAWHLSDAGKPFDAKIEDDGFWKTIERGDRFGYGDKIHVDLHTEAERETSGKLRTTRTVTKVHHIVRHTGQQISLPSPTELT